MVHYSCDLCGRSLNPEADRRYEVRLEIWPKLACCDHGSFADHAIDDDMDPLEIIEQIIESEGPEAIEEPVSPTCLKYDLCEDCHKKFIADPLGRKPLSNIHFSAN